MHRRKIKSPRYLNLMPTPNFFTQGSPYLKHPLLTPERKVKEIDFVLQHAKVEPSAAILDVGCGFGRHSIELARRGYKVVGIDSSATMIAAAEERSAGIWGQPTFTQARAEEFTSQDQFDAAICLFSTLGQIDSQGENSNLVKRVAEVLRPKGHFIVEVPNHLWVAENLKAEERFGDNENYTHITRQYDQKNKIVSEKFELVSPQGIQEYFLRYRLYSQKELGELFSLANLNIRFIFGDYDGNPYTYYSPVIILVTQSS